MYPKLLHIYGPIEINSFSFAIGLGLTVFMWLTLRNPERKAIINKDDYLNLVIESGIAGIIGGRILHVISEWKNYDNIFQMVSIWNGGLSILGCVIAIIIYGYLFLKKRNINPLPIMDLAAVYAPVMHSIARFGCLLAGCCYGSPSNLPWAITYKNPEVAAPLDISLHPTQVYSSLTFLLIFLFMRFIASKYTKKPGELSAIYLILLGFERLIIDFFRGDRIINSQTSFITTSWLSLHQWIAIGLISAAFVALISINKISRRYESL